MHWNKHLTLLFTHIGCGLSTSRSGDQKILSSETFLLRAEVLDNSFSTQFNGLYVYPFHTGAGKNIAALGRYKSVYPKAHLCMNQVVFSYDNASVPQYRLGCHIFDQSESWSRLTIDAGVNKSGDQFDVDIEGYLTFIIPNHSAKPLWIVCDWNHGVPELFSSITNSINEVPGNCNIMRLKVVPY